MGDPIYVIHDADGNLTVAFRKMAVDAICLRGDGYVMYLNGAEIEFPNAKNIKSAICRIFDVEEVDIEKASP